MKQVVCHTPRQQTDCLQEDSSRRAIATADGCRYFDTGARQFAVATVEGGYPWQLNCHPRLEDLVATLRWRTIDQTWPLYRSPPFASQYDGPPAHFPRASGGFLCG